MKPVAKYMISYLLVLTFGATALIQMALFIAHQIWGFSIKWNVFQYCFDVIKETTFGHGILEITFYALMLYSLFRIGYRMLKQAYLSFELHKRVKQLEHKNLSYRLNRKYKNWNVDFIVLDTDEMTAMAAGLLKPKIIVSTALLKQLSRDEIKAVLLHEFFHCQQRDPLKSFLISLLKDGFGYIPVITSATHSCKTWMELLADRYSIRIMGTEQHIGSAMLQLAKPSSSIPIAGVRFAESAINYRMLQVLHPEKAVQVPLIQSRSLFQSIIILMVMFLMVLGGCA